MSSGTQVTDMNTIKANIVLRILFVVGLAAVKTAAAARELSGSPIASLDPATVTTQDMKLEWLKITAVPLGVFLIGACTWGCIKNSVVWRSLTSERGVEPHESDADEMRPVERPNDFSHVDGSDLEEGIGFSLRRMDEGPAMAAQTILMMQHSALLFPDDDGKGRAPTDVTP